MYSYFISISTFCKEAFIYKWDSQVLPCNALNFLRVFNRLRISPCIHTIPMIITTTAAAIKTTAISMMRLSVLGFTVLSAVFFMAKPWEIFSSISASVKSCWLSPTSDGFARNGSLCTECGVWMIISKGLWLHFVVAVFLKNRQVSKGALHTPYTQV